MSKKKLVLTYPNLRWHKLDVQTVWNLNPSILCLLGKMVEDDVDVTIIDAQFYDLTLDEFKNKIAEVDPDYVGISMLTSEYAPILHDAALAVKSVKDQTIVIAGGVHVTIEHQAVIADGNIDYAVRGEGEYTLQKLVRFLNGTGEFPTQGLVFREKGRIVTQKQSYIEDLSALPMPDYNLVTMEDYVLVGARYGPLRPPEFPFVRMVITRGCPVGCSFCQVEAISGKPVRSPSPAQVVDELLYLKANYGLKSFLIDDDNIVIKKKFFKSLLKEMIDRKLGLKFIIAAFAIFALDDEMLDLMIQAGCIGVNVAIESGNQRVMNDVVMKPVNLKLVPPMIEKIKEAGMFVLANFIIGYPGEKWDEIRETINYAEHCGADYIKLFIAVPLKGTKMWDMAEKLDAFDTSPHSVEVNWRFSQIKSEEWGPRDVSILRAYEWDRINFSDPERRKRVTEIWGMDDDDLSAIRHATRNAVIAGFSDRDETTHKKIEEHKKQKTLLKTDGGNILIN